MVFKCARLFSTWGLLSYGCPKFFECVAVRCEISQALSLLAAGFPSMEFSPDKFVGSESGSEVHSFMPSLVHNLIQFRKNKSKSA
jgi:hypothetical protein